MPVPGWYLEDRELDGLRMPAHASKAVMRGLTAAATPTDAGRIQAPTLIIYGGTDDLLTFRDQEILADRIPGAILKVYPDAGHLVLWEHPARVARTRQRSFARSRSGTRSSPPATASRASGTASGYCGLPSAVPDRPHP